MDYFGILRRSFDITLRHRALWLFGFLLALFSAGGNAGNGFQYRFQGGERFPLSGLSPAFLFTLAIVLGLIALVLIVVALIVNYVSQTALIGMVGEIEEGTSPTVRRGFEIGWSRRALRLFGADVAVFVPVLVAVVLLIGGLIVLLVSADQVGGEGAAPVLLICCVFIAILVFIPLAVILNVLRQFFYRRIALAGDGVFDAIRSGWEIVRANAGPVAVIWLLMFVIGLVWAAVNFILVVVTFALVGGPAAAVYALLRSGIAAALAALPLAIIALVALAGINALYTVFSSAVWTLTYLELLQRPVEAQSPEEDIA